MPHTRRTPLMRRYQNWLAQTRGLHFESYDALWRWSVTDLDGFWQSVWDYFEMQSPTPHSAALGRNVMPGAQWFPARQVNSRPAGAAPCGCRPRGGHACRDCRERAR